MEVLIFLGVTMAIFISATGLINGKQAQADFTQSTRDFQSKVTDLINDVATGNYPKNDNLKCQLSGGAGSQVAISTAASAQGTNLDCIFLGKVLQFNTGNNASLNIISVAGTRLNASGAEVANLTEALPKSIAGVPAGPDLTEAYNFQGGLRFVDLVTKDSGGAISHPGSIALFTSFLQTNANGIVSNSLITNTLAVPGTATNSSKATVITQIDGSAIRTASLNPTVIICMEQGGAGGSSTRRAALIIGRNNRQPSTELHIGDAVNAVDMIDGVSDGSPTCAF